MYKNLDQGIQSVENHQPYEWIVQGFCATSIFVSATTIALMTPFYSKEAEARGVNVELHGVVYGTYQLVMLLVSPFCCKLVSRLGPRKLYQYSSLGLLAGLVIFGVLEFTANMSLFLSLSIISRAVQAAACTGVLTACYVFISIQSVRLPATMFALLQSYVAIGVALGPTIGGALYDVGGFYLPFTVLSCMVFTLLPGSFCVFHEYGHTTCDDFNGVDVFVDFVKSPSVILSSIGMLNTAMTQGFVAATLEIHIRQFSLSPTLVGVILAVNGMIFAIFGPLWGYLCDKVASPFGINVVGNLCVFVAFIMIGPSPIFAIDTQLWLVVVGLAIQGFGIGSSYMSTFSITLRHSLEIGFPDDISTHVVISAVGNSLLSLGIWLGASVSGVFVEWIGFPESSWIFVTVSATLVLLQIWYSARERCKTTDKYDLTFMPILRTPQCKPFTAGKFSRYGLTELKNDDVSVFENPTNYLSRIDE